MPYGVQYPDVVDLVAFVPSSGEVVLAIIEERPWDDSDERLFELQRKIHNYVGFALDGGLEKNYPDYGKRPIRFELRCSKAPSVRTSQFLSQMANRLRSY